MSWSMTYISSIGPKEPECRNIAKTPVFLLSDLF